MAAGMLNVVAVLLLFFTTVTIIVGFGSDQWILLPRGFVGLTRYCMRGICQYPWESDIEALDEGMPAWFTMCQVFMSFAVIFLLLSVIASPLFLCDACQWGKKYGQFIGLNLLIAAGFIGISLAVLAAKVHYDRADFPVMMTTLSWSYYIVVAGSLALAIDGVLFLVLLKRSRYSHV